MSWHLPLTHSALAIQFQLFQHSVSAAASHVLHMHDAITSVYVCVTMPCNLQLYTSKPKLKQKWVGLVRLDYYREWTIREVDY